MRNILVIDQEGDAAPDLPGLGAVRLPTLRRAEGEGGAGSFSDGKITLSATRGTHGQDLFGPQQASLLGRVEQFIRQFARPSPSMRRFGSFAARAAMRNRAGFQQYPLIHLGSDGIRAFGRAYAAHLEQAGVRIATGTAATGCSPTKAGRRVMVRDRRSPPVP